MVSHIHGKQRMCADNGWLVGESRNQASLRYPFCNDILEPYPLHTSEFMRSVKAPSMLYYQNDPKLICLWTWFWGFLGHVALSPHTVDLRWQWIYLRTHLARMLVSHITVTDTRSCRYCMTMLEYLMALKRVENDINFSAFCSCFLVKSIVEPLLSPALCWPKKFNFLLASMRVSLQVELLDWQHYFWEHQESVPCQKNLQGVRSSQ